MRVLVDAFGGDNAPLEVIKGAVDAANDSNHDIILVGDQHKIKEVAFDESIPLDKVTIIHAEGAIPMDAEPRSILKEYKGCSMAEALRRLANDEGDAVISAGSTGALLMGATFLVKRLQGAGRPALAALLPGDKGPFLLIDTGANADCRPELLLQFAHMGSIYMGEMMGKPGTKPTVGLLNVGTEDTKGGTLQQETFALLKESNLNFVGNIEARDVPSNVVEVVVADGFSGNILLKSIEGTANMLLKNLKEALMSSGRTKLGAALAKPAFAQLKSKMNMDEYGGAPLLGIKKPVLKTHGNAKAPAIKSTILMAANYAEKDVTGKIETALAALVDSQDNE